MTYCDLHLYSELKDYQVSVLVKAFKNASNSLTFEKEQRNKTEITKNFFWIFSFISKWIRSIYVNCLID
jgi:hypothetical protein